MPSYISLPTTWRSYRDHKFYDVTTPYVFYNAGSSEIAGPRLLTLTDKRERERSLFAMSEHNKCIYKLDNGRLPERNNRHSWPPTIYY